MKTKSIKSNWIFSDNDEWKQKCTNKNSNMEKNYKKNVFDDFVAQNEWKMLKKYFR